MANILGRNDRRRRVLNEEALSASTAHLALRRAEDDDAPANSARYSERAGVEHHPQVTDFLPRRFSTFALLGGAAVISTAVVEALYWYVDPVTTEFSGGAIGPLVMQVAAGIEAWMSAMLLLVAAATCVMIYSLRRHRIDDIRGRYRVWLGASVACVAMSIDSVAPLHSAFATAATHFTGWTALRANSAWWLAAAGIPLAWVAVRAWLDARESRLAATALGAAYTLYGVSIGAYLAAWPAEDPRVGTMAASAATLIGQWMLLLGAVAYGRYVVLDAQALIPARARRSKRASQSATASKSEKAQQPMTAKAEPVASAPANTLRAFRQGMREAAEERKEAPSSRWVDGSAPVDEDYDDESGDDRGRKLSKADRKRLRKLKAQNRAA
jgi:hypothetical protein